MTLPCSGAVRLANQARNRSEPTTSHAMNIPLGDYFGKRPAFASFPCCRRGRSARLDRRNKPLRTTAGNTLDTRKGDVTRQPRMHFPLPVFRCVQVLL